MHISNVINYYICCIMYIIYIVIVFSCAMVVTGPCVIVFPPIWSYTICHQWSCNIKLNTNVWKKRSETSYLLAKSTANRHRWTKICHAARVDTGILNRTEHERLQKRSKMSHLWFKCSFNHHQWIKICHALTGVSVLVLWSLSAFYFLA